MTERELGSSLKGKIAETLVGMACAQGSNGEINSASPFKKVVATNTVKRR